MTRHYHFQSKSTKFSVVSTTHDVAGDVVRTAGGSPPPHQTILNLNEDESGGVTLTGVTGLYVSLNGSSPGTKLTWSKKKYSWQIKATGLETFYIISAIGDDLYWFDSLSIGTYVVVKPGRDIIPPDSEWFIIPA